MTDEMKERRHETDSIYENHPMTWSNQQDDDDSATYTHRARPHRHTTSWSPRSDQQTFTSKPQRSETIAPSLPPKQRQQPTNSRQELTKTRSLDNRKLGSNNELRDHSEQSIYISPEDIASLPDKNYGRIRAQDRRVMDHVRPIPNKPIQRIPVKTPTQNTNNNLQHSTGKPPASPTRFLSGNNSDLYTESGKLSDREVQSIPSTYTIGTRSPRSSSPELSTDKWANYPVPSAITTQANNLLTSEGTQENVRRISESTAIYGVAKGIGGNLVMDFNRIQAKLFKLYKKIESSPQSSALLEDLKAHLRLPEHESTNGVLERVYSSLAPTFDNNLSDDEMMYVVDFRRFRDKQDLRQKIIQMFAKPGPPSISYAKVDAKMDNLITEFCALVETMRVIRNEFIESPAHVRTALHGHSEGEILVKALRDNQLWIRWGTVTNLPPLSHLYMHKQPPSYEVRKAVTISFIAERQKAMPDLFKSVQDSNVLCPPIYSRLRVANSNQTAWQVAEYNESQGKFTSHKCKLPSWLEQEQNAYALLKSSNRTVFEAGEHPYALYCVYVIIIKDFTLAQEEKPKKTEREPSKATPSKFQYYIGSSSTGVLYRFAHVENSHCSRSLNVLREASSLKHFRCYEGCDLVEACLALSWARRQPRAVFVLNSFLPSNMSSFSLEMKKPFKERMLSLASSLIDGKKTGPLCDMRYGMNGTTTIHEEEDEI